MSLRAVLRGSSSPFSISRASVFAAHVTFIARALFKLRTSKVFPSFAQECFCVRFYEALRVHFRLLARVLLRPVSPVSREHFLSCGLRRFSLEETGGFSANKKPAGSRLKKHKNRRVHANTGGFTRAKWELAVVEAAF